VLSPNQWCWIPVDGPNRIPPESTGWAIVGGGEDVSTVVETQKNDKTERINSAGILPAGGSGSPGWGETSSTLYAPAVKRQYDGRSSTIHLVNTGMQGTTVAVYYYDGSGAYRWGGSQWLSPNGRVTFSPDGGGSGGCSTGGTICSARIVSFDDQALAGEVWEYDDADNLTASTYPLFSVGAGSIYFPDVTYQDTTSVPPPGPYRFYLPLVLRSEGYSSLSNGLWVQNVGSAGASVTVDFYLDDGTLVCTRSLFVSSLAARNFSDSGCSGGSFVGSAVATASQPLVGVAHEVSANGRGMTVYSSFLDGRRTAYGPLVYHDYLDVHTWDSDITVQNLADQAASVNLVYYDGAGNLAGSQLNEPISAHGRRIISPLVGGFKGSVVIESDQDIVAIIRLFNDALGGDPYAVYNASGR
jgi:hypothetical protein